MVLGWIRRPREVANEWKQQVSRAESGSSYELKEEEEVTGSRLQNERALNCRADGSDEEDKQDEDEVMLDVDLIESCSSNSSNQSNESTKIPKRTESEDKLGTLLYSSPQAVGSDFFGGRVVMQMNRIVVDLFLSFLDFKDLAKLRTLNKSWLNYVRSCPIRMDNYFGPVQLSVWKRRPRVRREWNITGIRILDSLPNEGLEDILVPEALEYLQLSCLCLPRRPTNTVLRLDSFTRLKWLYLDDMMQLRDLTELRHCSKSLRHLSLKRCMYLSDVSELANLSDLRHLEIRDCRSIQKLECIRSCIKLESITVSGVDSLADDFVVALSCCWKLSEINLSRIGGITDVAPICQLPLTKLVLRQLPLLKVLPANISDCSDLETLVASSCPLLRDVSSLKGCNMLREVDISNTMVSGVEFVQHCPNLEKLDLSVCNRLFFISTLRYSNSLSSLSLWKCMNIKDLTALRFCQSLKWVDITGVVETPPPSLKSIPRLICDKENGIFAHRNQLIEMP